MIFFCPFSATNTPRTIGRKAIPRKSVSPFLGAVPTRFARFHLITLHVGEPLHRIPMSRILMLCPVDRTDGDPEVERVPVFTVTEKVGVP